MVKYAEYINSEAWQKTRNRYKNSRLSQNCYCCLRSDVPMDLHHKTYKSLGKENLNHLTKVCRSCHEIIHEIVKEQKVHVWVATKFVRGLFQRPKAKTLAKIEKEQQKIARKIARKKIDPEAVLHLLDTKRGFSRELVTSWGVPWPLRHGWKKRLRGFLLRKQQRE